jgi:type II secretory pathway component GspD/PulD (secretin)
MIMLVSGAVVGCSIHEGIEEQRAEIDLKRAELEAAQNSTPKYKRIVLNERFYVPKISNEAISLPSWYNAKTSLQNVETPFIFVVQEAIEGNSVTVDYSDLTSQDKNKPISVRADSEKLGEVLRRIGEQAGYALSYVDGRAVYSKYERKTFPLVALPGKGVGKIGRDGSLGSSTANVSGVSTSMGELSSGMYAAIKVLDNDVFKDLQESIKKVLSENGEVYISTSGASAVVKDYPYNVREAERIVTYFNDEFSKLVEVKISLIDVITSNDYVLGVDVNAALKAMGDRVEFGSDSVFTTGGQGTLPTSQFSFSVLKGPFEGTQLLMDALKQQGDVSRTVFQKVVTANATMGTSKAVTRETYIAEQTGNTATSGGIISAGGTRQEVLETGQIINIYPRIHNDDVFVKLHSSVSANLGITTKNNEATQTYVESPKVADMEFDHTVIVPDGHTMVIGGMEVDSIISVLANAGYDVAGFSKSANSENKETLLTISVRILRGKRGRA